LTVLTACSPRTSARTGPSSPTTTTLFASTAGSRPVNSATWAMDSTPGVSKGSGAPGSSGNSGSRATDVAISRLAAYASLRATTFSPTSEGAMNSWAPAPPIIPTSLSTAYQVSPQRSKMRA